MDAVAIRDPARLEDSQTEKDDDLLIRRWLHGKAVRTQEEYGRDAAEFRLFTGRSLAQCTLDDLQSWEGELGLLMQQSSVRRKLAAVKSMLTFAQKTGFLQFNIGVALQLPKTRDTLADRILTANEVQRMIRYEKDRRNKLILRTFWESAMRVSELCSLSWRDLKRTRDGGQFNIFGKGEQSRSVPISEKLFSDLRVYRGDSKPSDAIFPSTRGGHLSKMGVWQIVRRAAESVGIEGGVSPHWIRHTAASEALYNGAPPQVVRDILGHKSMASIDHYAHVRPRDSISRYLTKADEDEER